MTFLYPQVLWALLVLAIPIIIHFFSFRRITVIRFSSVQFLRNVEQKTKNKRRIKHWLILLSRMLFFIFLVLAFAQPVLNKDTSIRYGKTLIYLDNSLSMSNEVAQGQSALDQAIQLINGIVEVSPFESQFVLVTNDNYGIPRSWDTKQQVLERLTEVDYSTSSFELAPFFRKVEEINDEIEVFVVSDFQENSIDLNTLSFPEMKNVHLLPVDYKYSSNAYVDTAFLSSPIILRAEPNTLNLVVANAGSDPISDMQVKLISNNQLLATSTVSLEGLSRKTINVNLDLASAAQDIIKVELQDFPVTFDNEYWIAINSTAIPVITVVKDKPESYFEKVYANQAIFELHVFRSSEVDYSIIDKSDLIIYDGADFIPDWMNNLENKSIVIVPGENVTEQSYVRFFRTKIAFDWKADRQPLQVPDFSSPFYSGIFQDKDLSNVDLPSASLLLQPESYTESLLETPFGEPYFSFAEYGNRLFLLGSPLDEQYTNLPTHSIFVPLFYKLAQLSSQPTGPLAYSTSDKLISLAANSGSLNNLTIKGPQGVIVPNARQEKDLLLLELPPDNLEAGVYTLEEGSDTLKTLAINIEKRESELAQYDRDQLRSVVENIEGVDVMRSTSMLNFSNQMQQRNAGIELWKYGLLFALACIVIEVLLIRLLK